MDAMDIQAVESKLSDVTVTAIPMTVQKTTNYNNNTPAPNSTALTAISNNSNSITCSTINLISSKDKDNGVSKYAQLLAVIEEMGKDVRPSYSGSRSSAERLKRGIVNARILVRECLMETERSARQ